MARVIVSGIQPTGRLHLGNWLGAVRPWVRLSAELADGDAAFFFLADLHAITVHQPAGELRGAVRTLAATLLGAGLQPERVALFQQSRVPAHAELQWLLACTARIGWLNRMTQFKEKSGRDREGASVGLYTYPVLQAADVLAYGATHVPVGEDQKQHLELARDIAQKFNLDTGAEVFRLPEPVIGEAAPRVRSLRDGTAKMSKSDPSEMSRIHLDDADEAIRQKVRKARTDAESLPREPVGLEGRPEARNLVEIMAAVEGRSTADVLAAHGGEGFGTFKAALGDRLADAIGPVREATAGWLASAERLDRVLEDGAGRARAAAAPTLAAARAALGLG